MAVFQFTAMDKNGANKKGSMEAENTKQVRQALRAQGLLPVAVQAATKMQKTKAHSNERISRRALATLTRQLTTLLQGGIPLEKALQLMAKQYEKPKLKNILLSIAAHIKEGHSLAASLDLYPRIFSEIYRISVAAGEHAGCLDQTLARLADYGESSQRNREKIKLALLYPAILSIAAFAAVGFLLGYVMPGIVKVFEDSEKKIPLITTIVMQASFVVSHYGIYVVLLISLAVVAFSYYMRSEKHRYEFDKKLYDFPLIGRLISTLNISNFLKTFSILHKNGAPMVQALEMSAKIIGNLYLREKFMQAARDVQQGKSLSSSLEDIKYFPVTALYMIASGESGGKLDDMLEFAARDQELWLQGKISTIIGIFEPAMILLMGLIVLVFVLAILLPILNYSQVVR